MIIFKLALRNILGAGLRTWLNVVVLSFSFVAIIWLQGFYQGMSEQASTAMIRSEIGGGQYWHQNYDPYDPLTLFDSHAKPPAELAALVSDQQATPILIVQGTLFPHGRLLPIVVKGIDPDQTILELPSRVLREEGDDVPALIGKSMAKTTNLQVGDYVTVRWRDAQGTFDALEVKIAAIMSTTVQSIDRGQIWLPLRKLQEMAGMPDEATLVVVSRNLHTAPQVPKWVFHSQEDLLKEIRELVKTKTIGASIFYAILLMLALLAIFDTQVLSIFRRRREIGTLVALGMTRSQVIKLFTLEGAMHGLLAALVATLYGLPLLLYSSRHGWTMPQGTEQYGLNIGKTLFPSYSLGLVVGTTLIVLVSVTIVSFLPTRRIAKLKPTDALRGKLE